MTPTARVLILAKDDSLAGPLAQGLDRLDWRTVTARTAEGALAVLSDLSVEAVIIDARDDEIAHLATAARLKSAYAPRRLPVIAFGTFEGTVENGPFDIVIPPPVHASQAAMRLESLVRLAVAEEEYELRARTFRDRGRDLDKPVVDSSKLQILTVGEPSPMFLALSHGLSSRGAETTAAFTAYTAFDYLHERSFDAVVLWAGETHAEAMSIASGMRRNTRLFHVPAVLYLRDGVDVALNDAYGRGLSDVISAQTAEGAAARRIVTLARAYRRESAIRRALDKAKTSGLMDATTGLFTRELFAGHLVHLAKALQLRQRPLSVAVLRLVEGKDGPRLRREGHLERALPQIGSMIGRLVRSQDTAARLGPDLFALALPAANLAAAQIAAERIAAVIGCTAFEAGADRAPFTVDFTIGVAEMGSGESAAQTLERAAAVAAQRKAG